MPPPGEAGLVSTPDLINALAHLPSPALGRSQPSTSVRKLPLCSGSLPAPAKSILLFQPRKNPHTHTKYRHTLILSFPPIFNQKPRALVGSMLHFLTMKLKDKRVEKRSATP